SCGSGSASGGFAHRLGSAVGRGVDVLAPATDVVIGSGRQPGVPVTVGGQSWQLFVSDGLGGEGYDVVNDVVPFDGIDAVPDGESGGDGLRTGPQHSDPQDVDHGIAGLGQRVVVNSRAVQRAYVLVPVDGNGQPVVLGNGGIVVASTARPRLGP